MALHADTICSRKRKQVITNYLIEVLTLKKKVFYLFNYEKININPKFDKEHFAIRF